MSTYTRLPVAFVRGEGVWLWDEQNRRHLDALSGIAVCGLGHAHPALAAALSDQVATLLHTSNLYRIPLQETLGARLCEISGMERVFFCNSGAEANEAAIKLARRLGHARGVHLPRIAVMEGAFHGRTLATLTATANAKAQQGFEPLVVKRPLNDVVRRPDGKPLRVHAGTGRDDHACRFEKILNNRIGGHGGGKNHPLDPPRWHSVESLVQRFPQGLQQIPARRGFCLQQDAGFIDEHGIGLSAAHVQS